MLQSFIYMGIGLITGCILGLIISIYRYPIWEVKKMIRHTRQKGTAMCEWVHEKNLADHEDKIIVKPSCDILYSYTFFEVSSGPYLLKMPPLDRYFSFAFLNINTDVLGYYTNRDVKEGQAVEVIISHTKDPEIHTELPVIRLDARTCWLIGRFGINSREDLSSVNQIQQQIELSSIKQV